MFDIDGTMYPNWRMYIVSGPFALRNHRLIRAFAAARKRIRALPGPVDVHAVQAEIVAERLGGEPDLVRAAIDREIYARWEQLLRRVPLFPEVPRVIDELRKEGIALGVLSDFPTNQKLDLLGIAGRWDAVLSSEEVGALKPDPAPFLAIARELNTDPSDVLYVGNNYAYDVIGAKRAGMKAAHLVGRAPSGSVADFSFRRFRDLLHWIRGVDD